MTANIILPRDYILTNDHLYFAVVLEHIEDSRLFCSLRYQKSPGVAPVKFSTALAYKYLAETHPEYLYSSNLLDTTTICVPISSIAKVFKPGVALKHIINHNSSGGLLEKVRDIINLFKEQDIDMHHFGITGSILLGFQNEQSDIDLVIYQREEYFKTQEAIAGMIAGGGFAMPDDLIWEQTYSKRDCAISFDEYTLHEKRKLNKFIYQGTKVDISLQPQNPFHIIASTKTIKLGHQDITARVIDAKDSFSYPAIYTVKHHLINEIRVYTATYFGQAIEGETIEAAGMIEQDIHGNKYMVIGTSREAPDEYLKSLTLMDKYS